MLEKPAMRSLEKQFEKEKDNLGELEVVHFGDSECPCIGFDNIEGSITLSYDKERPEESKVQYPADLGSRCEKWEDGRHPDCMPGGFPGPGKGWCNQAWCLVDPCNCRIPVRPEPFQLSPETRFRGRQLHYSYATCATTATKDLFRDVLPVIGNTGCRCVGFTDIPGTTEVNWKGRNGEANQTVEYPAELGGACQTWDEDTHPMCRTPGKKPDWCAKRWCFVDPCQCNLPTPPKVTMYLPWATFTGKSLYYSYETCGNSDTFTAALNLEACVNQKTRDMCLGLKVRNGVQKCAWTGTNCLGAELVSHPLCAHLNKNEEPEYLKGDWTDLGRALGGTRSLARSPSSAIILNLLLVVGLGSSFLVAEAR